MTRYLLIKRGLYWRPDGCGYTGLKREAGRYSDKESAWVETEGHLSDPSTARVHEDRAPRFAPRCCSEVAMKETGRLIDGALALVRKCIKAEETRRAHLKTGSVAAGFCDGRLEALRASLAELEGST